MNGRTFRALGAVVCLAVPALTACSTQRPMLYPNEHYKQVGETDAQKDVDDCLARAKEFAKSGPAMSAKAGAAAKSGAVGTAIGAAAGAVGGAIGGSAGIGAAIGAVSGAVTGVLGSVFGGLFGSSGPDPTETGYADRCLREKGYDPVGWK